MNRRLLKVAATLVALGLGVFSVFLGHLALLNAIGPSTEYHNPVIGTGHVVDGKTYVYLGDEFYVWIFVIRHKTNGDCRFEIERYAEYVGGPKHSKRHLISKTKLEFKGANELRRTRWPVPSEPYYLGYAIDKQGRPQPKKPLLPDGVDEQEFTFYVVGRYYCNILDHIFPRYIQGGDRPNITPRVNAILRRHKP